VKLKKFLPQDSSPSTVCPAGLARFVDRQSLSRVQICHLDRAASEARNEAAGVTYKRKQKQRPPARGNVDEAKSRVSRGSLDPIVGDMWQHVSDPC